MDRSRPLAVGVILGVLGVSVFVWRAKDVTESARQDSGPPQSSIETSEPLIQHEGQALADHRARAHRPPNPFAHVPTSREGMDFESDPFVAESIEEQQWLDRNGFPNAEQWKVYSAAPDGLLRQSAESGDPIAAVMLDSRMLLQGDLDASGRLLHAGGKGSMFALSMLSAYMAGSPSGDPVLGYAVSRVMEMRGDTRVAIARDGIFRTELTPEQRMRGERMALDLFAQLRDDFPNRKSVDPRPFPK